MATSQRPPVSKHRLNRTLHNPENTLGYSHLTVSGIKMTYIRITGQIILLDDLWMLYTFNKIVVNISIIKKRSGFTACFPSAAHC